jgi:hypothetical protein
MTRTCPECGRQTPGPSKDDRWAAFTDDELEAIQHWEDLVTQHTQPTTNELEINLRSEIEAELQRRT